jgi:hypothetical protein
MRASTSPSKGIWAAGLGLLILLSILAALQYRWLGEVSEAEKERMQARMHSSAARFARDFDRELTRALAALGPGGPTRRDRESYGERRARWRSSALFPDLVRAVFVASPGDDRGLQLFRVEEDGRLRARGVPQDLAGLRSRLENLGLLDTSRAAPALPPRGDGRGCAGARRPDSGSESGYT